MAEVIKILLAFTVTNPNESFGIFCGLIVLVWNIFPIISIKHYHDTNKY